MPEYDVVYGNGCKNVTRVREADLPDFISNLIFIGQLLQEVRLRVPITDCTCDNENCPQCGYEHGKG